MPTREEIQAALQATGSNYQMPDDEYSGNVPVDHAPGVTSTPASYQTSGPAPEPSRPPPVASEPPPVEKTMSMPEDAPVPPPVTAPRATAPRPKATAGAVRQAAPAAAAEKPDPLPGQVTDADILGLPSNRKNPAPAKEAPQADNLPANPYEDKPRPADGIEDVAFNPSDKTRSLRAQSTASDNRTLELQGERADIVEGYGEQRHGIQNARARQAVQSINEARDRSADAGERYEDTRAQMVEEQRALKEKMGKPPFDTVGLVMSLVGALAAAHGKPEAGRMLQQGVGAAVNSRMNRWKGEIEGGQQNLEGMGKLVNMDRLHAADEQEGALAIQKAVTAEFDSALDEAGAQAKTQQDVNAIEMARAEFRKRLVEGEEATRAKAQAAAHRRMVNNKLANASTEEERKWIAEHYGDVGRNIDAANIKNDTSRAKLGSELIGQQKSASEIGLMDAKAAKERAKAEGKPYTGFIPGKVFTRELPTALESKVGEKSMAYGGIQSGYQRLVSLAEKVKKGGSHWNADDVEEARKIRESMVGQESNFNGLGAPTGKEHDQVISGIADPQAFFQRADSRELLLRAQRNLKGNFDGALRGIGIYDENAPEAKGGGSAPSTRRVRFSDGEERDLDPATIQALLNQGSKLTAVE